MRELYRNSCGIRKEWNYHFNVSEYLVTLFTQSPDQFLGSYHVSITENDDGTVTMTVTNTTGLESGTRFPGNGTYSIEDMVRGNGFSMWPKSILNNRIGPWFFGFQLLSNYTHTYHWTETIPLPCKK